MHFYIISFIICYFNKHLFRPKQTFFIKIINLINLYFLVLKLNIAEVEKLTDSDSQFVTRGREMAKTKRSPYLGKTMEIPAIKLDEIKSKLTKSKRKYFELTVSTFGGMSPEERAKKAPTRGRKPTNNAKPITQVQYICEVVNDKCLIKALM